MENRKLANSSGPSSGKLSVSHAFKSYDSGKKGFLTSHECKCSFIFLFGCKPSCAFLRDLYCAALPSLLERADAKISRFSLDEFTAVCGLYEREHKKQQRSSSGAAGSTTHA